MWIPRIVRRVVVGKPHLNDRMSGELHWILKLIFILPIEIPIIDLEQREFLSRWKGHPHIQRAWPGSERAGKCLTARRPQANRISSGDLICLFPGWDVDRIGLEHYRDGM